MYAEFSSRIPSSNSCRPVLAILCYWVHYRFVVIVVVVVGVVIGGKSEQSTFVQTTAHRRGLKNEAKTNHLRSGPFYKTLLNPILPQFEPLSPQPDLLGIPFYKERFQRDAPPWPV